MPQPLYKDLTKRTNDLLTKEYPTETKIDFNRKSLQGGNLEGNVVFRKDGPALTLTPKYKFSINQDPASALVELTSAKTLKGEVTYEPRAVPGLKLVDTVTVSADSEAVPTLAAEYRLKNATLNSSFEYRAKGSTTKAAAVFGYQAFSFGVLAEYFLGKVDQSFKEIATSAVYATPAYDVGAFARINSRAVSPKTEVGASYFQNITKEYAVGAEAIFDTTHPEERPKLGVAAQFRPDLLNTFKLKVDGQGKVTGSLQQQVASNLKLTLATSVDTNRFTHVNFNNASNVGVQLSIQD